MLRRTLGCSLVAVATSFGCNMRSTSDRASSDASVATTTSPLARLHAVYGGASHVLPTTIGGRLDASPVGWTARTSSSVTIDLPRAADQSFSVHASGASLDVRPLDAKAVQGQLVEGIVEYPLGARLGGAMLQIPLEDGVEEVVELAQPPKERALRWELRLRGIAGLRLVESRVLEAVDDKGNPLLRTQAPVVIDSAGQTRTGSLAIEGCAVDTDVSLPWGRAITAPGADRCTVVAHFDDEGLAYPILVDPAWTNTASMASKRSSHRAVPVVATTGGCTVGCVVVTGGHNGSSAVATTESWNSSTKTWASLGSFTGARYMHVAEAFGNKILVAGGYNGTSGLATSYILDITSGGWVSAGSLPGGARWSSASATVQQLGGTSGYSYVLGGRGSSAFSAKVDRFSYDGSKWETIADLPGVTTNASALGISYSSLSAPSQTATVIVAGGQSMTNVARKNVWYTDAAAFATPASVAWTAGPDLSVGRWDFAMTATPASSGLSTVYFGGGTTVPTGSSPTATTSIEQMTGYQGSARTMSSGPGVLGVRRTDLGATFFSIGSSQVVAFIGGSSSSSSSGALANVDLANKPLSTVASGSMGAARKGPQVTRLGDLALVTGGTNGTGALSTAEIYQPQANGGTCTAGADCRSLNCVDGYCCNSTCNGQCQACNIPGALGACTTVNLTNAPAGYGPGEPIVRSGTARTQCTDYGTACGYRCDGASATACSVTPNGTTCATASCTGTTGKLASTCLAGGCQTQVTVDCKPYACGSTACRSSCTLNSHCATGYKCEGGICVTAGTAGAPCTTATDCTSGLYCVDNTCCGSKSCTAPQKCNTAEAPGECKLPLGTACTSTTASQCSSGLCADGVCCNESCSGQCEACDVGGSVGTCIAVSGAPHGKRTKCTGTGTCQAQCNGSDTTKCGPLPGISTTCAAATCSGSSFTPARYCDGFGACTPASSSTCGAYKCDVASCKTSCATSSDCNTGYFCDLGVCRTTGAAGTECSDASECASGYCVDDRCCTVGSCPSGQTCSATTNGTCAKPIAATCTSSAECGSGNCVDGVCCSTTCTGQCEACDVAGTAGTCAPVVGTPHGARMACSGTGACQASCDGSNRIACAAVPGTSTTCATPSCTGGIAKTAAYCDGAGNCGTPTSKACSPYLCDVTDCKTVCTADTDCTTGYRCFENSCVPKAGVACTTALDCASGNCVDGVCCDGPCTGQCEACDVPGSEGKCSPITGAPHGSRTACSDGAGDTCKALACDGTKDRLKCSAYANGIDKVCRLASCKDGVQTEAGYCDGAGACKAAVPKSCSPYACGADACKTSCTTNTDCAASFVCAGGECKPAVTATCTDDLASSQPKEGGAPKPCGAYLCDRSTGNCYDKCSDSGQCAPGNVCNAGACEAAPSAGTDEGGGCTFGASARRPGAVSLAVLALAFFGVRRARGARRRS